MPCNISFITGWTIGSRKTHQTIVNMLAEYLFINKLNIRKEIEHFFSATKSVWISVEYRLGPEHKFPIWLDDGCEVTRQILANKTAYGMNDILVLQTTDCLYRW
jgi:acetyl esterase/lipase